MLLQIDTDMRHFADITKRYQNNDFAEYEGAGAAGGLGFAFLNYLNARLESGVKLILKAIQLENSLKDADYIITGEGRLDYQTVMGKAPIEVAKLAKKYGVKVFGLAGSVSEDARESCFKPLSEFYTDAKYAPIIIMTNAARKDGVGSCLKIRRDRPAPMKGDTA